MSEVREAVRRFRQMPWSTLGIILILALGTGANTAVVAVASMASCSGRCPTARPRLAVIEWPLPLQELEEWRRSLRTVDALAGFASATHPRTRRAADRSDRVRDKRLRRRSAARGRDHPGCGERRHRQRSPASHTTGRDGDPRGEWPARRNADDEPGRDSR